ncbi:MAG TPA: class I SAM-dependent methyltransferase [Ktedonobacterales bacterium]|jgi:SAM-dependent methyltransferase
MADADPPAEGWSEATSTHFLDMADIYVPLRGEQIATMVGLIPARADEAFTVVEMAAGGGALAHAVLQAFPRCRYVALDGSSVMRAHLAQALAPFGDRLSVSHFALEESAWHAELPSPLRCVVSSLAVHHLTDEQKQSLFAELARRIEPGGALLLADIVEAANSRVEQVFARQWDESTRAQSLALHGDLSAYEAFHADNWNYYTGAGKDDLDKPSRLADQLLWLRDAGFEQVDCFWMAAGHAIYGGYR